MSGAPLGLLVIATFLAFVAALHYATYQQSGGRSRSPLWLAFTTTALALLFIVAGVLGYNLSRQSRFPGGSAWSDNVIWWEIWAGLTSAVVAALCWRVGLRSLRKAA